MKLILSATPAFLIIGNPISNVSRFISMAVICSDVPQCISGLIDKYKIHAENDQLQTLPSSGIVRAVRRREYPVKTPTSIVFFAFTSSNSMAINWAASGAVAILALENHKLIIFLDA
jgi:hypothetical protein